MSNEPPASRNAPGMTGSLVSPGINIYPLSRAGTWHEPQDSEGEGLHVVGVAEFRGYTHGLRLDRVIATLGAHSTKQLNSSTQSFT